jgi:hypothetical protein
MPSLSHHRVDVALKLHLDQNTIVIYNKFNGNFKSHINFEMTQERPEHESSL